MTEEVQFSAPPVVEYQGARPRSVVVKLDYPFTLDGRLVEQISIRRMTTAEVSAYVTELSKAEGGVPSLPLFSEPQEVLNHLDDDDMVKLEEAMGDFLPRRLRVLAGSPPQAGETSSGSSPTS